MYLRSLLGDTKKRSNKRATGDDDMRVDVIRLSGENVKRKGKT
jgi:hypothetical protein